MAALETHWITGPTGHGQLVQPGKGRPPCHAAISPPVRTAGCPLRRGRGRPRYPPRVGSGGVPASGAANRPRLVRTGSGDQPGTAGQAGRGTANGRVRQRAAESLKGRSPLHASRFRTAHSANGSVCAQGGERWHSVRASRPWHSPCLPALRGRRISTPSRRSAPGRGPSRRLWRSSMSCSGELPASCFCCS